jgi:hypothetical protein
MRTLKELDSSQKYLKSTPVASYRSDIVFDAPRWSFRPGIQLKEGWSIFLRKTKYFLGEYAVSNALMIAFVAKTRNRSTSAGFIQASPINRVQFAFNWTCAILALICVLPLMGLVALAIKFD